MSSRSVKQTVSYIRKAIHECWDSQSPLDVSDEAFKNLDEQIKAYQDVHRFLTDDEYDGEDDDYSVEKSVEAEPEEVLKEQDEEKEDDKDDDEDEEDEES